jgi:hypothetical protein
MFRNYAVRVSGLAGRLLASRAAAEDALLGRSLHAIAHAVSAMRIGREAALASGGRGADAPVSVKRGGLQHAGRTREGQPVRSCAARRWSESGSRTDGGDSRGAGAWQPALVAAQAAAPPAPAAAPGPAAAAPAGDVVAVRGSGSTAVQSLMTAVLGNFTKQLPQAALTYDAVGSGQGAAAQGRRRQAFSPRAAL